MNKPINIYISKDLRKQAKKICQKYTVSLSTLTDIVILNILKYADKEKDIIFKEYLHKNNFKEKTSIKPRILFNGLSAAPNKNKIATNCLKLYLLKELYKVMEMETVSKCYTAIDRELTERYDPYANYNENLRSIVKMMKENPDYMESLTNGHGK